MIEIPQELKERMKEERLNQYRAQLYSFQMDLNAYIAISDDVMIKKTQESIANGEKAYQAVLEML